MRKTKDKARMRTYAIPSRTTPGTTYTVTLVDDDVSRCECIGWLSHKKPCRHIRAVRALEATK